MLPSNSIKEYNYPMNKEVYKYLLKTYGSNPGLWFGFLTELIRTLVSRVYIVILMAQITAELASGHFAEAKTQTIYFLIVYVVGFLIGAAGDLVSIYTENKEYARLMIVFYRKLVNKDLAFYRDNQTGYLASAFREHLDSMMHLVRMTRGELLNTSISLIVPPIVLFVASPTIGLVAIAVVLIQFFYVTWSSSKAQQYRKMSHVIYRKITGEVSDVITNIVAFKSGGVEDRALNRMKGLVKEETIAFEKRRSSGIYLDLPRGLITAVGIASAIYAVVSKAEGVNPTSLALMVLTITYMFQIIRNVGALPELIMQHDDLVAKIYPTLEFLSDEYETVQDSPEPVKLNIQEGSIEIQNVSFSYSSHSLNGKRIPVFDNLNISIKGGEHVGIVGLSGAGKSTLANLLLRFDNIDSGSIKIDGTDIQKVRQSELRKSIAYVPQEPLLFHRSIKENISYYNTDRSDTEIIEAAKAAHAHEFIEKLPDNYETIVGERGIKLSGGQKQRVVIARAILKRTPIMIFDEATSALDSESEQIIQRVLPEIMGKQTAIVVAHRLSTVAGLDRIIVMHDGQVIEEGTHQQLLDKKGRYNSLWQKQTSEFARI